MLKTKKIKVKPGLRLNVFDSAVKRSYQNEMVVVFIHGGTGSLHHWKYQLDYFAQKYRTIAYDWRGCGLSDEAGSYTFDDHYYDLLSLLKVLKVPGKPIMVAHSYGCLLARRYLKEYHLEKFVNVSLGFSGSLGWFLRLVLTLPRKIQIPIYRLFLVPKNPILTKPLIASKKTPLHKVKEALDLSKLPPLDFYLGLKTFRKKESLLWMKNYQEKMLVLTGREDRRVNGRTVKKINKLFPEIKVQVVDDAGHILPFETPGLFNELVEGFIKVDRF